MFKNITKYIRGYSQKIRFFKKLKSNLTLLTFKIHILLVLQNFKNCNWRKHLHHI